MLFRLENMLDKLLITFWAKVKNRPLLEKPKPMNIVKQEVQDVRSIIMIDKFLALFAQLVQAGDLLYKAYDALKDFFKFKQWRQ